MDIFIGKKLRYLSNITPGIRRTRVVVSWIGNLPGDSDMLFQVTPRDFPCSYFSIDMADKFFTNDICINEKITIL